MPAVFIILICLVGAGFSLVVFACWLVFSIFRLLASGIESLFLSRPKRAAIPHAQQTPAGWTCSRLTCRTANPAHARYCRRCGRAVIAEPVRARVAFASL
jgi:hypothetical protein